MRAGRRPGRWSTRLAPLALTAVAVVAAACGTTPTTAPSPTDVPASAVLPAGAHIVHPAPAVASAATCTDPTASYAPPATLPTPGAMPAGSWMAHIQQRGSLVVGVDENTYLWGYLDPVTVQPTGFDIAMLQQVAQAIFGSKDAITYRVVPNADRARAVKSGEVDILAETMTINCAREQDIDFSTVYFQAGQQILVPANSSITGPADLAGKRVCATDGSTSLNNLAAVAPKAILWSVPNESDCLVMLQQGQVDAISTDNAILQGLADQDPNTKIVGPAFTAEPYGLAISKAHPDFTRFVNGVLAQERSDGTWASICATWLGSACPATPPAATYKVGS
jgi:polar amino acid transport system substrate-binding protein